MFVLKLIMKICVLPFSLILIIAQWIRTFFTGIASVILGLLSGLCWIVAILGCLMGICSGQETIQVLTMAFVAFIIPQCCNWLIDQIVFLRCLLAKFVRS